MQAVVIVILCCFMLARSPDVLHGAEMRTDIPLGGCIGWRQHDDRKIAHFPQNGKLAVGNLAGADGGAAFPPPV